MKINKNYLKQIILEELTSIKGGGQGSGMAIGKLSSIDDDAHQDLEIDKNVIKDLQFYFDDFKRKVDLKDIKYSDVRSLFKKIANVLDAYDNKQTDEEKQKFSKTFVNMFLIKNNIKFPKSKDGYFYGYSDLDSRKEEIINISNTVRSFMGNLLLFQFYSLDDAKKILDKAGIEHLGDHKKALKLGKFISVSDPKYMTHNKD